MTEQVHQQPGERCATRENHDIHDVLGDSAWCGFLDLLNRTKMETFDKKLTIGEILGLDEDLLLQSTVDTNGHFLQAWLRNAKRQSEMLASMQAFLEEMSKSARKVQGVLKESMTKASWKIGYASLPNEVLVRILSNVGCMVPFPRVRKNMSLVCRRFRDLVRCVPEFWSELDNRFRLDTLDLSLVLSKDVELAIHIWIGEKVSAESIEFTRKVVSHCHPWKSFKLIADDWSGTLDRLSALQIGMLLQGLDLPVLQEASINHPSCHNELDTIIFDFYTSWDAPRLETAYFANMIPETNDSFKLKKITIDIVRQSTNEGVEWTPVQLANYLSEQPCVEILEIGLTIDEMFGAEMFNFEPLSIPSLRTVRFRNLGIPCAPWMTIHCILASLEVSVLETLEICISVDGFVTKDINKLLLGKEFTNLKRLSLSVDNIGHDCRPSFEAFSAILSSTPKLRYLEIESPNFPVGLSVPSSQTHGVTQRPPLRTIHLKRCMGVTEHSIERLLKWIQEDDTNNFEHVRVTNCQNVIRPDYCSEWWDTAVARKKLILD